MHFQHGQHALQRFDVLKALGHAHVEVGHRFARSRVAVEHHAFPVVERDHHIGVQQGL